MEHNLPGRAGWVRLAECFREIQHERAGFPLCFSRLEVRNDLFHGLRVSKVEQMETELRKLSQAETPSDSCLAGRLDRRRVGIHPRIRTFDPRGRARPCRRPECASARARGLVSAATQIYYASFDAIFLKLPPALRGRLEAQIDDIGARLASYPHHRLKGSHRYRARVGDYRIIYTFELSQDRIHLLAVGHRREIYRQV